MKRKAVLMLGSFAWCMLGLSGSACGEPEVEMTLDQRLEAAGQHANSALEAVGQRWASRPSEYHAWETLGDDFDSHLDSLAELAEGELLEQAQTKEGDAPLFKLVLMADYRRRHAERIHDITEHFSKPAWAKRADIRPVVPEVTGDWAEAGDRLAWEYLLLRPSARPPADSFVFMMRATDALVRIGEPASVLTLSIMIRSTLPGIGKPNWLRNDYVEGMIWGIARIPRGASLIALLDNAEWLRRSSPYPSGSDGPDAESVSSEDSIRRVRNAPLATLRATLRRDSHERWKPALDEFAEMATPKHKTILIEVMLSTLFDDVVRGQRRKKARAAKDENQ